MISPLSFTSTEFSPIHKPQEIYEISLIDTNIAPSVIETNNPLPETTTYAYKKVANRTKPVATTLPENFRIVRRIPCDPLETLPELPTHPPEFTEGTRYTLERKEAMAVNAEGFLWPEEEKLVHYLIKVQEEGFA